jgi:hypothetical protein
MVAEKQEGFRMKVHNKIVNNVDKIISLKTHVGATPYYGLSLPG